jgi:anti-anti-sigma factor
MEQTNKIRVEQRGIVTLIEVEGDLTAFSEPLLHEAYKNASDQGARKILFNFDENAYMNSGGIAAVIQILAETKRNDQQIGITGLSEHFLKIFNMVGITKVAQIYNSVEEAIEDLSALT